MYGDTDRPFRWASITKPSPPSPASSRPRKASSISTSPPDRRARRSGTCSRTHPGCPFEGPPRSRRRARGASTRTPGSRSSPTHVAARRDAVRPTTCARGCSIRSPDRAASSRLPGSDYTARCPTCSASRPSCWRRRSSRPRRSPRRRRPFPALPAFFPALADEPNDWGLGVRARTRSRRTGRARTSPRTFGHFGGSGTFLWVDPEPGIALACLTDREFVPGARGVAAALGRRSRRSGVSFRRPRTASGASGVLERIEVAAGDDGRGHGQPPEAVRGMFRRQSATSPK